MGRSSKGGNSGSGGTDQVEPVGAGLIDTGFSDGADDIGTELPGNAASVDGADIGDGSGSAGGSGGFTSPGDASADAPLGRFPDGRPRKRRARGSGGGGGRGPSTAPSASQTTRSLDGLIFTAHLMMSGLLGNAMIALDETESKKLAGAIVQVTELYDVKMVDEKTMAWLNLAGVAGTIYGPRLGAVFLDKREKAAEKARAQRAPQPFQVIRPDPTQQM